MSTLAATPGKSASEVIQNLEVLVRKDAKCGLHRAVAGGVDIAHTQGNATPGPPAKPADAEQRISLPGSSLSAAVDRIEGKRIFKAEERHMATERHSAPDGDTNAMASEKRAADVQPLSSPALAKNEANGGHPTEEQV